MQRIVWMALVLAGCDPIWSIRNPVAIGHVDDACVEAGLRAWMPVVHRDPDPQPGVHEFAVSSPATYPEPLRVVWNTQRSELSLVIWRLGPHAPANVLAEYRSVREEVAAKIGAACGAPVTLGPETCIRCD